MVKMEYLPGNEFELVAIAIALFGLKSPVVLLTNFIILVSH